MPSNPLGKPGSKHTAFNTELHHPIARQTSAIRHVLWGNGVADCGMLLESISMELVVSSLSTWLVAGASAGSAGRVVVLSAISCPSLCPDQSNRRVFRWRIDPQHGKAAQGGRGWRVHRTRSVPAPAGNRPVLRVEHYLCFFCWLADGLQVEGDTEHRHKLANDQNSAAAEVAGAATEKRDVNYHG
jgi:hypothetical protein